MNKFSFDILKLKKFKNIQTNVRKYLDNLFMI